MNIKTKVTAASLDRYNDIQRRKREWQEADERSKEMREQDKERYRQAIVPELKAIRDAILSELSQYDLLDFDVTVDEWGGNWQDQTYKVSIYCNQNRMFDTDSALTWRYHVDVKDGEVVRESSSASGLQAVTPSQIASLKQTVNALETLSTMDWDALINRQPPDIESFVSEGSEGPSLADYRALDDEEIDSLAGERVLVQSKVSGQWYQIVKTSPKFIQYISVPEYAIDEAGSIDEVLERYDFVEKKSRDNFEAMIQRPLVLKEY